MMQINEYQKQTLRTANDECDLVNCCFGMIGETGEVVDLIKKHLYQGHPMGESLKAKITVELGDTMWYISVLASKCGIQMSDVLEWNIQKLRARYPDGFSAERSLNRAEQEV